MVTVVPLAVRAVTLVPLASTTSPPASAILITTPAAGCVFGNDWSSAITSKPPIGASCAAT